MYSEKILLGLSFNRILNFASILRPNFFQTKNFQFDYGSMDDSVRDGESVEKFMSINLFILLPSPVTFKSI